MNYLSEHLSRQNKKLIISKTALQKGMVVSCRYTNKEGQSKDNMLLILNPGVGKKIHALSLGNFSSRKFNSLAKSVGIVEIKKYAMRGLDMSKLRMDMSSKRFYSSFLDHVKTEYNDAYRTLFKAKLGAIQLVDYNFDKGIQR